MWTTWIALAAFTFFTILNWRNYLKTRRRIFQVAAGMMLLCAVLMLFHALGLA